MAYSVTLLLLALAVSIDSFSVGLTYGLRKMRIPFKSLLIIATCSAVVLSLAMAIGHLLIRFVSPSAAETVGGAILIAIGVWVLYQFFKPEPQKEVLLHEK